MLKLNRLPSGYIDMCCNLFFYDRESMSLDGYHLLKKSLIVDRSDDKIMGKHITANLTALTAKHQLSEVRSHLLHRPVLNYRAIPAFEGWIEIKTSFYLSPANLQKIIKYVDCLNHFSGEEFKYW